MNSPFHQRVKQVIKRIPKGKVATYGQIAMLAGDPRGARQVSWVLNSSSEKDKLPWHRVINRQGRISLPENMGYELQRALLSDEGIEFGLRDTIDLERFQWRPRVGHKA
jgi:methylated-DNA-protein-cysteine methyltransferase-like protein